MKKKKLSSLALNKKSISNLSNVTDEIKGGSVETCTGYHSCGNCTVDCGNDPYESVFLCHNTRGVTCPIK